jgi:cbb3-type cytochrome c oxidase subunit III
VRSAALLVALLASIALSGCGGGGVTPDTGDLSNGKALFTQSCGSCHVLADAGTQGMVGPNLDEAFAGSRAQGFEENTFVQVVRQQIAYPGIGLGMPADIVTGEDANDVAAYVARYAGNPGIPPSQALPGQTGGGTTAAAGGSTDGKAIFTQNCASCHTLAAAGTNGQVGPNLDDAKPPKELVVDRVTNGKGVMPSFKDQLSQEQIQAVADFVSSQAGR